MSWQSVKLEDVFNIARGGSPRPIANFITNDSDGLNWISIKDASNSGKYITETKLKIRKEGLIKSRLVKPGDFLLTNSMSFGRPYIMKTTGCIHDGWLVLSGDKEIINQDYFYHLLGSDLLHKKFSTLAAGAVVKNLNINLVKGVEILLPPLPEQQKIAAILDAADSLRQKDRQLIDHYTTLSQSLFLDMFGDPVTNPNDFSLGTIRELLSSAKYGTSAKAEDNGEYPYLRMNNITYDGAMDFSSLKYISLEEKDKDKYIVKKGDVLFNRTNSKELVGKTGLYNENYDMAIAGYLIRLRTNDKASPYFVWGYLNSKHGKLVLRHMCKSIVGMANINAQELQNIKILLPPITLQNQFAERIQAIEAQKQLAQASLDKSEALFNSLLQRAFNGELTA